MVFLKCTWCDTQTPVSGLTNCPNCGGTLPLSKGADPGPNPPLTPRTLPAKYIKRVKYTNNVYTMIGIIFTVPFFWTVILPIIGIFMWRKGKRVANEELNPLINGAATQGTITNISQDFTIKLNGRSPYVVEFTFDFQGTKIPGNVGNLFDANVLMKNPGDKVWVVFLPDKPEQSSIWPPM